MTEEVRNKLKVVYDGVAGKIPEVLEVFTDFFGEEYVDCSFMSFDEMLEWLNGETLGSMGVTSFHTSMYNIDVQDYEANGRGKTFLEYIPDLGIIEYVTPRIVEKLSSTLLTRGSIPSTKFCYITIYWPKAKVTNEFERSVEISKLFARVECTTRGKTLNRFTMCRTEFNMLHWASDYAHSHLPGIDKSDPGKFRQPCTGSGPINDTISTLKDHFDIQIWGLYALELAKYVTVESVAGVPHRRLENIGRSSIVSDSQIAVVNDIPNYADYRGNGLKPVYILEFIKYFLGKKLMKFAYRNGSYGLGETFTDFWVKVSNCFIEWYNAAFRAGRFRMDLDGLKQKNVVKNYIVADGRVYSSDFVTTLETVASINGRELFKFKGETQRLNITDAREVSTRNTSLLVNPIICYVILTKALEIINYSYGREETRGAETAPSEKYYFL